MNINYPEVFGPWKKILFLIHINSVKFFKEKHSLKLHKPHAQMYPHDIVASLTLSLINWVILAETKRNTLH